MPGYYAGGMCFNTQLGAAQAWALGQVTYLRTSNNNTFLGMPTAGGTEAAPTFVVTWSCLACTGTPSPPAPLTYALRMQPCTVTSPFQLTSTESAAYAAGVVVVWLAAVALKGSMRVVRQD